MHSDLWGSSATQSLGGRGARYFLSIIDDFSRKLWVYILKNKSEAFESFKNWCSEVETEKGLPVKCLRTDNGLEFLNFEFQDYCKEKGIKRYKTVSANPQQNGVVERINRTILERVRCMRLNSRLPKQFWG